MYVNVRTQKKLERLETLKNEIENLRASLREDLKSKDPKTKLLALAVSLIDKTCERVGNKNSAENGHFGVTVWQKKHFSFKGDSCSISYVGKSGVKQKKTIKEKYLREAIKKLYDSASNPDSCIFEQENVYITNKDVNEYLKEFRVTAKDIRGFHANDKMCRNLREVRRKGESLDENPNKEKVLKDEFKKALDLTAKDLGHEASTLRSQYLSPYMEKEYMKGGSVIQNYKKASLWPIFDPFFNLREIAKHQILLEDHLTQRRKRCLDCIRKHLLSIEAFSEEALSLMEDKHLPYQPLFELLVKMTSLMWGFFQEELPKKSILEQVRQTIRLVRKKIVPLTLNVKIATKSHSEKEEEATEALIKKAPKKKPPRHDLRKKRIDEEDPDLKPSKSEEKDLSRNYKHI